MFWGMPERRLVTFDSYPARGPDQRLSSVLQKLAS